MTAMLHLVAYSQPDGVDPSQLSRVTDGFAALANAVAGCELVAIGRNLSPSTLAKGWDFGVVVSFRDEAVRTAYIAHPQHEELGRETRDGFYQACIVLDIPDLSANPGASA